MAINEMGFGAAKANLILNDMDEDLSIWTENELPISIGDDVSIWCGASAHKYANELNWYKNDVLVRSGNGKMNVLNKFSFHINIFDFYSDRYASDTA